MTKLQRQSLSSVDYLYHVGIVAAGRQYRHCILSTTDLRSYHTLSWRWRRQHILEHLQDHDGDPSQACKISYAGSLSILIAGRHSNFVWAPRGMDSNGKLEQRCHGGIAWIVIRAALAYATRPTSRLHVCLAVLHYNNNTVHSQ